jgi:hypothetical protein
MNELTKYRFTCTLTLGDIYGQIIVWLGIIFASLASAMALMSHPIYAFSAVGLIIVVSLPFLLFTFVTTLFNNIQISPLTEKEANPQRRRQSAPQSSSTVKAA